ncbi:hypothetical protein ACFQZ4_23265 [Catellatospora coxensis]
MTLRAAAFPTVECTARLAARAAAIDPARARHFRRPGAAYPPGPD